MEKLGAWNNWHLLIIIICLELHRTGRGTTNCTSRWEQSLFIFTWMNFVFGRSPYIEKTVTVRSMSVVWWKLVCSVHSLEYDVPQHPDRQLWTGRPSANIGSTIMTGAFCTGVCYAVVNHCGQPLTGTTIQGLDTFVRWVPHLTAKELRGLLVYI